jgi:UPF0271 protein
MRPIDLNADVGEGFGRWVLGDDDALMGIITSANVACGFHAGDPSIIRRTCAAAVRHGVAIGIDDDGGLDEFVGDIGVV